MRNICFIPVRKGSKGIANKNWKNLYGKPLFCWILDSLIESGIGDEIWIATDAPEIKAIVDGQYAGRANIYNRSPENARDSSLTLEVVHEFLDHYPEVSDRDSLVVLQATSPFTTVTELKSLDKMIKSGDYDSIVACCKLKKFRWSASGEPLDYSLNKRKPLRQEYNGFWVESGSFYVSKINQIIRTHQFLSGKIGIFEVNPIATIDIDEEIDWKMAETYLHLCRGTII